MPVSCIVQGGLGNALFQIGNCISYGLKYGLDYCIPVKSINPHKSEPNLPVFPNVKYCSYKRNITARMYTEQHFHYAEIPKVDGNYIMLTGYFQSFRYVHDYRDEILRIFGFDDIVTIPDICAIHLRLGDYKFFPEHHPIVSKEYIGVAIGNMWFKGYKKFKVFSDEINEAKEIIQSLKWFSELEFEYSEGQSALEDLRLMSSCSSIITANSTLSLWAAYINPNPEKIMISPRKWFGDASAQNDTKDLYLPNSIIL